MAKAPGPTKQPPGFEVASPPDPQRRFVLRTLAGLGGLAGLSAALPGPSLAARTPRADLILTGGRVLTLDAQNSVAEAVAVRGRRLLAVGSRPQVERHRDHGTRVIDLRGGVVTPGLIDTHAHLPFYGLRESGFLLNLQGIETRDRVLAALHDRVKKTPAGKWVHAWGLESQSMTYFDRGQLDRVSREHPLLVLHTSGQWGFANTRALEIARIGDRTSAPAGGRIVRDTNGRPTGLLIHYPAINIVRRHAMRLGAAQLQSATMWAARAYARQGVTTVHDNFIYVIRSSVFNTYAFLADSLPVHIRAYAYLPNLPAAIASCGLTFPETGIPRAEIEAAMAQLARSFGGSDFARARVRRFLEMGLPRLRAHYRGVFDRIWGGYKLAVDGGGPTSMWYRKPGMSLHRPGVFERIVALCHRTGQQISVHAGGDQAVDIALAAFEAALKSRPRSDHRHRIEHAIRPADEAFGRIARLGVVICTHPQWLWAWGRKLARVEQGSGADGGRTPIPLRTFLRQGVHLCLGADPPAYPEIRPQIALAQAAMRVSREGYRFDRSEAVTLPEALRLQTMGGAYAGFEERDKGSLEPGKSADLAVWDTDLASAPADRVGRAKCRLTIVAGRVVHEA